MPVTIDIPEPLRGQIEAAWGSDLSRAVKEALAVEGYRTGKLSTGQVAELLALSLDAADGFLKATGVDPLFTPADLDRDVASLERLLGGGTPRP